MAKTIVVGSSDSSEQNSPNEAVYWNLDSQVGPSCPNRLDDVQLVQFAYFCLSLGGPFFPTDPVLIALARAVTPGAPYTGGPSEPLTLAIKRHQALRGGTQDGRVSPIQSQTVGPTAAKTWILVPLNTYMAKTLRDNNSPGPFRWPRLHLHPTCPASLAAISLRAFLMPSAPVV